MFRTVTQVFSLAAIVMASACGADVDYRTSGADAVSNQASGEEQPSFNATGVVTYFSSGEVLVRLHAPITRSDKPEKQCETMGKSLAIASDVTRLAAADFSKVPSDRKSQNELKDALHGKGVWARANSPRFSSYIGRLNKEDGVLRFPSTGESRNILCK